MNAVNTQSAKAHRSALLCFGLALLTMATTAWFVVEGINATEPDSPARWAKVASGVLLLVLEASAFGLAGQWPEHSKVLRTLGWAVLALEITLMSVSQISIGMTAAKSASNGAGTIEEIRAQAKESRAAADALRADAANMRKSKHGWLQQQAGEKSAAAAEQSKSAAAAVASLEKHGAVTVSTPIVEIVGKGGLIGLSIALSVALSLSGIVLMHVAGSLWRRASGALPVDVQILELLHKIHGAAPVVMPVAMQVQTDAPAPALAAPVAPVPAPAPAPASFKPAEAIEPKDYSTGLSYSSKIKLAGAGLLGAAGALTAPITHAAPAAAPVNVDIPSPVNVDIPAPMKTGVSAPVNDDVLTSPEPVNVDIPSPVNVDIPDAPKKARKPRVVRDGAVMDSGLTEHDGARYRRALAGVKSGKFRPSIAGLAAGVDASAPVARRYLVAMADAGVIVPSGRGFALVKKGGEA